ncbi:MAG TPA: hypothetical protein VFV52_01695 [Bacilli bacterium]|nr:hypothetical protein [Bacilli bacterium]
MKSKKFLIGSVILSLSLLPTVANAWSGTVDYWSDISGLSYTWGSNLQGSSLSKTAFQQAVSDWNSTPTRVYFTYNSSSFTEFNTECITDSSEYGYTQVYSLDLDPQYFKSFLNVCKSDFSQTNIARSVANHELGHGLTLYDDNFTSPTAIMNQNRNRTNVYVPGSDDILGINTKYPIN